MAIGREDGFLEVIYMLVWININTLMKRYFKSWKKTTEERPLNRFQNLTLIPSSLYPPVSYFPSPDNPKFFMALLDSLRNAITCWLPLREGYISNNLDPPRHRVMSLICFYRWLLPSPESQLSLSRSESTSCKVHHWPKFFFWNRSFSLLNIWK